MPGDNIVVTAVKELWYHTTIYMNRTHLSKPHHLFCIMGFFQILGLPVTMRWKFMSEYDKVLASFSPGGGGGSSAVFFPGCVSMKSKEMGLLFQT